MVCTLSPYGTYLGQLDEIFLEKDSGDAQDPPSSEEQNGVSVEDDKLDEAVQVSHGFGPIGSCSSSSSRVKVGVCICVCVFPCGCLPDGLYITRRVISFLTHGGFILNRNFMMRHGSPLVLLSFHTRGLKNSPLKSIICINN